MLIRTADGQVVETSFEDDGFQRSPSAAQPRDVPGQGDEFSVRYVQTWLKDLSLSLMTTAHGLTACAARQLRRTWPRPAISAALRRISPDYRKRLHGCRCHAARARRLLRCAAMMT